MGTCISVIVCTYNREEYLYRTLEHIARNDFPAGDYEIVLVDNNSTDGTAEQCRRFRRDYPAVAFRCFRETAQGLSFARNRGIAEARGEILVFLDDDAFMEKDYLRRLDRYLRQYPAAAAFGGRILPEFEGGGAPRWMGRWSRSWVSALDRGSRVSLFRGRSYPIGANMGCRRSALPAGGFDTALGRNGESLTGGEEKDLFLRMKAGGGDIYYFPGLTVRHIIPERRTTRDYIRRLALGIGRSERLRTLRISRRAFRGRLFAEGCKWAAALALLLLYTLRCSPQKGGILLYFRLYVTRGLMENDKKQR